MMLATTDNMIWQFLLPHIKYLQSQGNVVECVCAKTGFWFDELKDKYNLVCHEIPFKRNPFNFSTFKQFKQLKKLQKQEQYNLIYCQQPVGGVMGRMIAKKFKIPCLYTAHGFHFFKGNSGLKNFVFKSIEKHFAKYTDALVTINQEDYEAALKFKAKHVYKINGIGVDLSKYKVNKNLDKIAFKKSLGLNENDYVITSIGELNENKNTLRLIDVINKIKNQNIKYIICGRGSLEQKYKEQIEKYNLQDRVKLLGFRKDIPDILTVTDLYIMPSYREGLSKSMMEAMCYGLPVVASKIRGNVDLLGNNEGGILCDPTNNQDFVEAILTISNNPNYQKKLGTRNLEFIKNFDIKVVLNQLEEIYKEIE